MTIFTKGMGKIMKSKMRKAFVDKPTFPGPNTINILNRELAKKQMKTRRFDVVSGAARKRKNQPGKSFIEIDARVKREALRDYYKSLPHKRYPPPKGKK
tara:strand:+ start:42 stop:338 length:297 start_codon:yes stop_codon:yes gene_type:complete